MSDFYRIPEADAVLVPADDLRATTAAVLQAAGLLAEDAELAADVLVTADLRGVDSHGVSNLLPVYVAGLRNGHLNARPRWRVLRDAPAAASLDADGGLGLVLAPRAMETAIGKARETGVGMVAVSGGRHLGMAAYHSMLALPHDMIGICMSAVGPRVAPTFGSEPRLGTNPIAVAAPAGTEPPFVFDAATSSVAMNKIRLAQRLGADVPPGAIADASGAPIMRPVPAPDEFLLLPLGATRELGSHKGYGLAAIVEIMSSVLAGSAVLAHLGRGFANHFVCAVDIAAFTPVDGFKATMDDFLRLLKSTPPAPGQARVLVAGQLEWETEVMRRAAGIPLHPMVVEWIGNICEELSVPARLATS